VCTIEDHCLPVGFGSAVLELLSDRGIVLQRPLVRIGVPDEFVSHGTQAEQRARYGLNAQGIVARIVDAFGLSEEAAKSAEGISQVG
jgi:1-deoxy-D-xylulose-5-phosphate synthase